MAADKFHINSNGDVKECKATVRGCRFGGDVEHFTDHAEAIKVAEQRSKEEAPDEFGTITRKPQKFAENKEPTVDEKFKQLILEKASQRGLTAQGLQDVGAIFESEFERRLSFNPWDHKLSQEELNEIESVNRELFSSLVTNGGDMPAKATGPVSKKLNEAVKILPDNVKSSLKDYPINTKYVHGNTKRHAGLSSMGSFETLVPSIHKIHETNPVPADAPENAIIPIDKYPMVSDIHNPNSAQRMYIKKGDGPEYETRWVGESMGRKGFKKISNTAEVFINGELVTVNKPVYSMADRMYQYGAEISVSRGTPENEQSILLHEYCHTVQYISKISPKRQEQEMFEHIAKNKDFSDKYNVNYYTGFPDDYMGAASKAELLPMATEGLFSASVPTRGFFYGSDRGENAHKVRRWVTGLWLSLANTQID